MGKRRRKRRQGSGKGDGQRERKRERKREKKSGMKTSKIDEPLLPTVVTSYGTHEDTNDEDCVGGV